MCTFQLSDLGNGEVTVFCLQIKREVTFITLDDVLLQFGTGFASFTIALVYDFRNHTFVIGNEFIIVAYYFRFVNSLGFACVRMFVLSAITVKSECGDRLWRWPNWNGLDRL
jgi:hypothetical protein